MSKYIDLIEKLSPADKATITAYLETYGCNKDYLLPLENWLQNWSHSNQRLYKLLGNNFICKFPFSYEKTSDVLRKELYNLIEEEDGKGFIVNYNNFCYHYLEKHEEQLELTWEDLFFFKKILNINNFVDNKILGSIKYKKPGAKKILQIQSGTKPFRAINQIINYFKDDYEFDLNALEEFRKQHAILFSEKIIKGQICISIHPMDFMTMSDNSSNWTSCMSWKTNGCYHIGTVEMMNSNNVVCCYLENNTPFVFDGDRINPETGEIIGVWNNKRWRQLFYVTKDIIMSGKPYPYVSTDLTKTLLEHIKDFAKENLNWSYQFGPERYKDMTHIDSLYKMDHQREWMRAKSYKKHNIIWDTQGMYNDMLNDHVTSYLCYRNKVDHTKIISVSGKANCICCNQQVIEFSYDSDEYNDRYDYVGSVVCEECTTTKFRCDFCGCIDSKGKLYETSHGKICQYCFDKRVRICPDCGKGFYVEYPINNIRYNPYIYKDIITGKTNYKEVQDLFEKNGSFTLDYDPYNNKEREEFLKEKYIRNEIVWERLYCCSDCADKIKPELETSKNSFEFTKKVYWSSRNEKYYLADPAKIEKYRYDNLQKASLEELELGLNHA